MHEELNQIKQTAQRIKELREIQGYSIEQMAHNTDVSVEEYRRYEAGENDFSFTFIYKVAKCCHVDPTDILTGSAPTLSGYTVVRAGEGLPIARRSGFDYKNLAPGFKNKIAEPFKVTLPYSVDDEEKPIKLSSHAGQEMDIMIEGSIKIQIGKHIEILNEGDCIYYDSKNPHGMIATNGADCKFLAILI